MPNANHKFLASVILVVAFLSGCGEDPANIDYPPRAIKYVTLGDQASEESRRFAGVVKASTVSQVAFEINGQVLEMLANVGDGVDKGQVIARLDPEPYQLQVDQADFSLNQARAALTDARSKFQQQKRLWDKRFATKTALDSATSTLRNAEGQVGIAESQLELRKRDLLKTTLSAPFAGVVAAKKVEVFEEVAAGAPIYTLQTEGDFEIEVSVPEALIRRIKIGDKVAITFPSFVAPSSRGADTGVVAAGPLQGVVSEVSPQAADGTAFPVTVKLLEAPETVRPGMSAEITFRFETAATASAFSAPISALKPSLDENAIVYLYDAEAGVVRETPVRVVSVEGNDLQIVGPLKAGDIIAAAGVGYMHDGMKVRLLDPATGF